MIFGITYTSCNNKFCLSTTKEPAAIIGISESFAATNPSPNGRGKDIDSGDNQHYPSRVMPLYSYYYLF